MGADKNDAGLFGWKNFKIPDDWTVVAHDRTPRSVSVLVYEKKPSNISDSGIWFDLV